MVGAMMMTMGIHDDCDVDDGDDECGNGGDDDGVDSDVGGGGHWGEDIHV